MTVLGNHNMAACQRGRGEEPMKATANTTEPDLETLTALYRMMVRIRAAEEEIASLVETDGFRTPCHLYTGQEAIAAGVCLALDHDDYVWGGHRSHGHYLAKGGRMDALIAEIYGKATGCSRGRGGSMHLIAPAVRVLGTVPLVAATIPLAVGSALASRQRGDGRVSVSFFGDGATEEGHFHESLNLAALYKLPVIFVCENNFYSSHMQLLQRQPKDAIDEMAIYCGIPTLRLDGNDVTAVYRATTEAVERGRRGEGPTLFECRTFRWRGHVGASRDMDVGVTRAGELLEWLQKDPIARTRRELCDHGVTEDVFTAIDAEAVNEVARAITFAQESPYPDAIEVLQHVYWTRKDDQ